MNKKVIALIIAGVVVVSSIVLAVVFLDPSRDLEKPDKYNVSSMVIDSISGGIDGMDTDVIDPTKPVLDLQIQAGGRYHASNLEPKNQYVAKAPSSGSTTITFTLLPVHATENEVVITPSSELISYGEVQKVANSKNTYTVTISYEAGFSETNGAEVKIAVENKPTISKRINLINPVESQQFAAVSFEDGALTESGSIFASDSALFIEEKIDESGETDKHIIIAKGVELSLTMPEGYAVVSAEGATVSSVSDDEEAIIIDENKLIANALGDTKIKFVKDGEEDIILKMEVVPYTNMLTWGDNFDQVGSGVLNIAQNDFRLDLSQTSIIGDVDETIANADNQYKITVKNDAGTEVSIATLKKVNFFKEKVVSTTATGIKTVDIVEEETVALDFSVGSGEYEISVEPLYNFANVSPIIIKVNIAGGANAVNVYNSFELSKKFADTSVKQIFMLANITPEYYNMTKAQWDTLVAEDADKAPESYNQVWDADELDDEASTWIEEYTPNQALILGSNPVAGYIAANEGTVQNIFDNWDSDEMYRQSGAPFKRRIKADPTAANSDFGLTVEGNNFTVDASKYPVAASTEANGNFGALLDTHISEAIASNHIGIFMIQDLRDGETVNAQTTINNLTIEGSSPRLIEELHANMPSDWGTGHELWPEDKAGNPYVGVERKDSEGNVIVSAAQNAWEYLINQRYAHNASAIQGVLSYKAHMVLDNVDISKVTIAVWMHNDNEVGGAELNNCIIENNFNSGIYAYASTILKLTGETKIINNAGFGIVVDDTSYGINSALTAADDMVLATLKTGIETKAGQLGITNTTQVEALSNAVISAMLNPEIEGGIGVRDLEITIGKDVEIYNPITFDSPFMVLNGYMPLAGPIDNTIVGNPAKGATPADGLEAFDPTKTIYANIAEGGGNGTVKAKYNAPILMRASSKPKIKDTSTPDENAIEDMFEATELELVVALGEILSPFGMASMAGVVADGIMELFNKDTPLPGGAKLSDFMANAQYILNWEDKEDKDEDNKPIVHTLRQGLVPAGAFNPAETQGFSKLMGDDNLQVALPSGYGLGGDGYGYIVLGIYDKVTA
ncbi:MAG: right-handed parallel beta-helix repeat-containing protein [Christensenellaceae bacterium]|jgi:hypothetical protein|nr:right-handed parallel beta-helix repeat-containing protein [Christensenellaceae bacterium]